MLKVNPRLEKIQVSIIRKISEACLKYQDSKEGKGLINLTIGEPDLLQPEKILDETIKYMKENKIGYSQLGGFLNLREEIAKDYKNKYNVNISPDEIIVTVGTTEGIATTIKTIIQEGDEVIIPLPAYPGYEPLITMAGAELVKIDTEEDGFKLTVNKLKKYITSKTRAIIVNYPCNPTGIVLDKKNIDEIIAFAKKNNLYIISDEVYSELIFQGEFHSFLRNDSRENVILLNGFSKSHSLTGWRVGYIIASKELRGQLLKVHQYNVTSASSIAQMAGLVALTNCNNIADRVKIYKKRGEELYKILKDGGMNPIKPQGAMYMFVSLKEYKIMDTLDFLMEFLEKERVALVPGEAFDVKGYIRISLVQDVEILKEAGKRLVSFVNSYKKS